MIKFITADDVLPLRNVVLREGKLTLNECRFPNDNAEEAFHLGCYVGEELACVASFHPKGYEGYAGKAYQLRGMATAEQYRGKGMGNMLVNFAITYLRGQKVNYLWCNARKVAVSFYMGTGFEVISPVFDVPGIGPHYVMYVKIQ
ncbi:GNAT family N-acetyltransferase [Mucilaginibacter psychrotolerans]|uniref:GNAT family N-acetyltransferase n=1 Tax=Mucilaginibacter psychrotolerans TaxID=1524096 RepID=A0A4Y8SQK7_9SPHI|nr:GNAT family N-acetyltransferase [Mucilaginibacter psychrotolerans]TFF40891.1 GNAT family N-acetyltransferase [Mucilaginibacter psychrotolerans]